jgi:hypothetical protein
MQESITNLCIPSNNTFNPHQTSNTRIIFAHVDRIDHDTTQNTTHGYEPQLTTKTNCSNKLIDVSHTHLAHSGKVSEKIIPSFFFEDNSQASDLPTAVGNRSCRWWSSHRSCFHLCRSCQCLLRRPAIVEDYTGRRRPAAPLHQPWSCGRTITGREREDLELGEVERRERRGHGMDSTKCLFYLAKVTSDGHIHFSHWQKSRG